MGNPGKQAAKLMIFDELTRKLKTHSAIFTRIHIFKLRGSVKSN